MRTLYMVQEVNWQYNDNWYYENGARPERVFASRENAQIQFNELEEDARDKIAAHVPEDEYEWWSQNLAATFGGMERISSLPKKTLSSRMKELGLPFPPNDTNEEWHAFWQAVDTPEKRTAAWQLFDRVRFYEVMEVEADL